MKRLLFLLFLLPSSFCFSQEPLPLKDGKVIYEEIDSFSGVSKADLYNRSKIWFANAFKSANSVIQMDDKETGQIIGKGNFSYFYQVLLSGATWVCDFTVRVDCKDNRARIILYDISCHNAGEMTAEWLVSHKTGNKQHLKAISANCPAIIQTFKKALSTQPSDNF